MDAQATFSCSFTQSDLGLAAAELPNLPRWRLGRADGACGRGRRPHDRGPRRPRGCRPRWSSKNDYSLDRSMVARSVNMANALPNWSRSATAQTADATLMFSAES